jgi:cytoskeletal protein RodZ
MIDDHTPIYAPPVSSAAARRQPAVAAKPPANERLRAYRRRLWRIRKRLIVTAIVLFAVLWSVIFVQLVSGHDPALAKKSAAATSSTSSAATSSGTTSSGTGTTSAVTTGQS